MYVRFGFPGRFSEVKFWFLYVLSAALLVLDCVTTSVILSLGGVELNPLVNWAGLFNVTVYKLMANAFVGFVSLRERFLWLLFGLVCVFSFVVLWNLVNIFWVL